MKKRVTLSLAPGTYLVSANPDKTRVWKIDGVTIEGHGLRLRRSSIAGLFKTLHREADRADASMERKRRRYTRGG